MPKSDSLNDVNLVRSPAPQKKTTKKSAASKAASKAKKAKKAAAAATAAAAAADPPAAAAPAAAPPAPAAAPPPAAAPAAGAPQAAAAALPPAAAAPAAAAAADARPPDGPEKRVTRGMLKAGTGVLLSPVKNDDRPQTRVVVAPKARGAATSGSSNRRAPAAPAAAAAPAAGTAAATTPKQPSASSTLARRRGAKKRKNAPVTSASARTSAASPATKSPRVSPRSPSSPADGKGSDTVQNDTLFNDALDPLSIEEKLYNCLQDVNRKKGMHEFRTVFAEYVDQSLGFTSDPPTLQRNFVQGCIVEVKIGDSNYMDVLVAMRPFIRNQLSDDGILRVQMHNNLSAMTIVSKGFSVNGVKFSPTFPSYNDRFVARQSLYYNVSGISPCLDETVILLLLSSINAHQIAIDEKRGMADISFQSPLSAEIGSSILHGFVICGGLLNVSPTVVSQR